MRSAPRGKHISGVEVTNVSQHGFWVLVGDKELFLAFEKFPWFKDASVARILDVKLLHGKHLHWPRLDVDLSLESIEHPERFPLLSRRSARGRPISGRPPGTSRPKKRRTGLRRG